MINFCTDVQSDEVATNICQFIFCDSMMLTIWHRVTVLSSSQDEMSSAHHLGVTNLRQCLIIPPSQHPSVSHHSHCQLFSPLISPLLIPEYSPLCHQPSVHLKWSAWLSTCWCKKWPLSIPQMSSTSTENWIWNGDDMWCCHLFWFMSADTWHMTLCQQRPVCGAWQQLAGYWYITPGPVNSAPLQGSGLV